MRESIFRTYGLLKHDDDNIRHLTQIDRANARIYPEIYHGSTRLFTEFANALMAGARAGAGAAPAQIVLLNTLVAAFVYGSVQFWDIHKAALTSLEIAKIYSARDIEIAKLNSLPASKSEYHPLVQQATERSPVARHIVQQSHDWRPALLLTAALTGTIQIQEVRFSGTEAQLVAKKLKRSREEKSILTKPLPPLVELGRWETQIQRTQKT